MIPATLEQREPWPGPCRSGSVASGFAFGSRGFRGSAIAGLAFNALKAIGRSMDGFDFYGTRATGRRRSVTYGMRVSPPWDG